ncbi:hypothetical protein VP01_1177g2 [Puccinia sorghi]|uniref:Uncharacterized protein n=1 Tax=Puccinia sorghi TaxID=27349 RepID=A0A0L6VSL4_9BASI|nr:hypothetical protein VP01_1177g2 [Puccinia sorghi]
MGVCLGKEIKACCFHFLNSSSSSPPRMDGGCMHGLTKKKRRKIKSVAACSLERKPARIPSRASRLHIERRHDRLLIHQRPNINYNLCPLSKSGFPHLLHLTPDQEFASISFPIYHHHYHLSRRRSYSRNMRRVAEYLVVSLSLLHGKMYLEAIPSHHRPASQDASNDYITTEGQMMMPSKGPCCWVSSSLHASVAHVHLTNTTKTGGACCLARQRRLRTWVRKKRDHFHGNWVNNHCKKNFGACCMSTAGSPIYKALFEKFLNHFLNLFENKFKLSIQKLGVIINNFWSKHQILEHEILALKCNPIISTPAHFTAWPCGTCCLSKDHRNNLWCTFGTSSIQTLKFLGALEQQLNPSWSWEPGGYNQEHLLGSGGWFMAGLSMCLWGRLQQEICKVSTGKNATAQTCTDPVNSKKIKLKDFKSSKPLYEESLRDFLCNNHAHSLIVKLEPKMCMLYVQKMVRHKYVQPPHKFIMLEEKCQIIKLHNTKGPFLGPDMCYCLGFCIGLIVSLL